MKRLSLIVTPLVLLLFAVVSCYSPVVPGQDDLHGSIRLLVNKEAISKTIEPAVDMEVDSFHIALTGPGSPITESVGGNESSVLVSSLLPGDWTVTVEAVNAVPEVIGRASRVVRVLAGQTATATITVVPLTGGGPLQLTMSWPAGVVGSPSVRAILYDAADAPNDISAAFSIDDSGDPIVATYEAEWEAGYYELTLQLLDGASAVVWGTTEVVRILAGTVPAVGVFTLVGSELNLAGEVEIVIATDLQNSIGVTLHGLIAVLPLSTDMTVTAAHTPQPSVSYRWYLNGSRLSDETNQDITLGSGLSEGNYRLSAVVRSSSAMGSTSIPFSVTAQQYIYVADSSNHRIVRMDDMAGTNWTTFFGTEGTGVGEFGVITSLTRGPDGKIYVADTYNHRMVRMDDLSFSGWVSYGSLGSGIGQFNEPCYLAFDTVGRIYVSDAKNHRVVRVDDMSGANWATYGTAGDGEHQFNQAVGIAVDSMDRIYVADKLNNRIVRIDDMTGTNWVSFGEYGSGSDQFYSPHGLTLDDNGRLYVADRFNHRIVRIDGMDGSGWLAFGSHGSGVGEFTYPAGLTIGPDGLIYICDQYNERLVRIDDMSGANWISIGSPGSGMYEFGVFPGPGGVYVGF